MKKLIVKNPYEKERKKNNFTPFLRAVHMYDENAQQPHTLIPVSIHPSTA